MESADDCGQGTVADRGFRGRVVVGGRSGKPEVTVIMYATTISARFPDDPGSSTLTPAV
ncbi:hypothetical protein [Micromonospora sp. MH99]|uniref:hypothetical protein n=1 Tax=Micromonospora sp. MH99 TaxID=1945510 RepID=UPI001F20D816|nr:hypothetical protein [Micromonospora sp. MH99]MCF0094286.1 hypothetical protein [Micromonospora sp. MH99]